MTQELQRLLHATSRSFYLTLRVLPGAVRSQIGLAYLLARATDTIADTELVPAADRLEALAALRSRILGQRTEPLDFQRLAAAQAPSTPVAERQLLERAESAVAVLHTFTEVDRADIRAVLSTITSGQELDLRCFGQRPAGSSETEGSPKDGSRPQGRGGIGALAEAADLDDYTYRVAGCVGEFWTKLTRRHCFPDAPMDDAAFVADGIRFGQGLQLVNILRDLPRDLRQGRCYLPAHDLAALGLQPADLLDPVNETQMGPLYRQWLARAQDHLTAGWRYTNTIPSWQLRLRLACAWPVLLGAKTLAKLRGGGVLDPARRLKVTRPEVRAILFGSLWRLLLPGLWKRQFEQVSRG